MDNINKVTIMIGKFTTFMKLRIIMKVRFTTNEK